MSDPRDILVRNEQAKLTATYLNGLAVGLAAVGGIAPWIGAAQAGGASVVLAVVTTGCTVVSVALRLGARRVLRRLVV